MNSKTRERVRYKVTSVTLPDGDDKTVEIEAVCTNSPAAPKWLPRVLEFEMKGSEGRPRGIPQVMGYVEAEIDLFPDADREAPEMPIRGVIETTLSDMKPQDVAKLAADIARELGRRGALR